MPDKTDRKHTMTHDQNFKNLILDYPRRALEFFATEEAGDMTPEVRITRCSGRPHEHSYEGSLRSVRKKPRKMRHVPCSRRKKEIPEDTRGHQHPWKQPSTEIVSMKHIILRYFNAAGADPECETGEDRDPETCLIPLAIRAALGQYSCPPLLRSPCVSSSILKARTYFEGGLYKKIRQTCHHTREKSL